MAESWNSRRRVEAAISHQEPDRVPIDLTITQEPYEKLRQALGFPPEEDLRASSFTEVRPHPQVLKALGVDITWVKLRKPHGWSPPSPMTDGGILDEWGVGRKKIYLSETVFLNEVSYSPLKDATTADLDSHTWPTPEDPGRVDGLEVEAQELYETTDLALMGRFGGTILEQAAYLRGWEQWLMDLVVNQEFAWKLMNIITDIQIKLDEMGIEVAGKYLTIFKLSGEDFGMQDRPLFSMKTWRELVRPVLERRWRAAREALDRHAPHVKLLLHSDGAIRPFLPDLIESGIDILDPIQPRCDGMDLYGLKQDFGNKLVFHGGVDTQEVLPFGTEAQVEAEVIRCLDALGPGGGYILAPVHNVQADVPPQNLIAMCRTVQEHGQYPLPARDPLEPVTVQY
ncbi:MAG: uroporphyrinogen decarboxylase family protein [Anaerolineales bacterium]